MMLLTVLLAGLFITSLLAILAQRLLPAILWLAAASAFLALALYALGAAELAVIELSVGAGLVTVLYVFAVNVAGATAANQERTGRQVVSSPLAAALVLVALAPLGWLALAGLAPAAGEGATTFATSFWELRALDVLLQLLLIVTGIIGVLGLLAETDKPAATSETARVEVSVAQPLAEEAVIARPMVCEKEPV
jgi:uncharacterized MnhB-related membrane protein